MRDDKFCVHRDRLIETLLIAGGLKKGQKLPANFEGTFENIVLPGRFGPIEGTYTVVVYSSPTVLAHKSSTHRTFVNCTKCNRLIPSGRFHQHRGTCKNLGESNVRGKV